MTQPLQAFWGGKEQGRSDRKPEDQADRRETKTKMDCLYLEAMLKTLALTQRAMIAIWELLKWSCFLNYGCWIEIGFEEK